LDVIFYSRHRVQAAQAEQNTQPDECRHGEKAHDRGSPPDLHEHCSDGSHHQHDWNQNQRPGRSRKRQEAGAEFRRQENQEQNPGHQQVAKMFSHREVEVCGVVSLRHFGLDAFGVQPYQLWKRFPQLRAEALNCGKTLAIDQFSVKMLSESTPEGKSK